MRTWLAHPLTSGMDIDDPRTTELRREIIRRKTLLREIYCEWYVAIVSALPVGDDPVLELGSGAGFLEDYIPNLISSEVFFCREVRMALDGLWLPFTDGLLRGIVMTDVLHHLPQPRRFLTEAARCVRPGGVVAMIEPWVTPWSRFIWAYLHHEPFAPQASAWELPQKGPLSGANSALPWIVFERDRARFEREFPMWKISAIKPVMPFRYLVSGGVSLRELMPEWTHSFWERLEDSLRPWPKTWAMFAEIVLLRRDG